MLSLVWVRVLAWGALALGLVGAAAWFINDQRDIGRTEATTELKAEGEQRRAVSQDKADGAASEFAGQQDEIRARPAKVLPEVSHALLRPICPVFQPFQPGIELPPSAASATGLVLADVPIPADLLDGLRRAGADPPGH